MITHKVRPKDTEIFIGKQGENNARQIMFKASYFRTGGVQESLSCYTKDRVTPRLIQ